LTTDLRSSNHQIKFHVKFSGHMAEQKVYVLSHWNLIHSLFSYLAFLTTELHIPLHYNIIQLYIILH